MRDGLNMLFIHNLIFFLKDLGLGFIVLNTFVGRTGAQPLGFLTVADSTNMRGARFSPFLHSVSASAAWTKQETRKWAPKNFTAGLNSIKIATTDTLRAAVAVFGTQKGKASWIRKPQRCQVGRSLKFTEWMDREWKVHNQILGLKRVSRVSKK